MADESFGNVGHHRGRCCLNLSRESKVPLKGTIPGYGIDLLNKVPCFLPAFEVFKAGELHSARRLGLSGLSRLLVYRVDVGCALESPTSSISQPSLLE